ncbi:uroporphyrinogen-III synthase [Arthrobacter sp. H14-L1]|uniref:uroporphyrinogen-III synthase n=1 Tax=Arthrobacter sp. H14-L1 TaxID=2996697 RepID=UPI00226EF5CE|nr:uroporphyrinogen-III synthase [Arthrobacter sp. H14-L1]MCY0903489.1 uroporphyrinogen-III synthase [Arthrobacter sp. H14-L1]
MSGDSALGGLRVAITRSPDRADALVRALQQHGASPYLVPLIDFELAGDQKAFSERLEALAAGKYDWLVVSSISTIRALKQWCAAHATTLAELVPDGTRIATIGPSSRRVLEAEGLAVELAPEDNQSAAGLVDLWPPGAARVLLPHSNLAEPSLAEGLSRAGATVDAVTAYVTVDYPAHPELRLTAVLASGDPGAHGGSAASDGPGSSTRVPELTPAQAKTLIGAGGLDAVVAASGSAARSIARQLAPLPKGCLLIAIGRPTHDEAIRLGLSVAATAQKATPAGIVEALSCAVPGRMASMPAVPAITAYPVDL